MDGGMYGIIPPWSAEEDTVTLQCFPLYTTLLALNNPTVNFLSLDIEGAEFQVFKTIPWDKVDIEVIVTELLHAGEVGGAGDDNDYVYNNCRCFQEPDLT